MLASSCKPTGSHTCRALFPLRSLAHHCPRLTSSSPVHSPATCPPSFTQIQLRPSSSNSRWKSRQGGDHFVREAKLQGLKSRAAFKLLEMDKTYRIFSRGATVVDLGYAPGSWSQVAKDRVGPYGIVLGIDLIPHQPPPGVSTIQGDFLDPRVQGMAKAFIEEAVWKKSVEKQARAEEEERHRKEKDDDGRVEEGMIREGEARGEDVVIQQTSYIEAERAAAREAAEARKMEQEAQGDGEEVNKKKVDEKVVSVVLSDMSAPWPQIHGFSINSLSNPYRRMMNTSGNRFRDQAGSMRLCNAALSFASDTLKPGGHFVCKYYQGPDDRDLLAKLKYMFKRVHRVKPESSRGESMEGFFVALDRKKGVTLEQYEEKQRKGGGQDGRPGDDPEDWE